MSLLFVLAFVHSSILVPPMCHQLVLLSNVNDLLTVTEHEIKVGVLMAKDANKNCLWFKRMFDDIDEVQRDDDLAQYYGNAAFEFSFIVFFSNEIN